jgi:repressor LexA
MKLTLNENQVFEFIKEHIKDKNYPPSLRDIVEGVGLSGVGAASYFVNSLVVKGKLRKEAGTARSLTLA